MRRGGGGGVQRVRAWSECSFIEKCDFRKGCTLGCAKRKQVSGGRGLRERGVAMGRGGGGDGRQKRGRGRRETYQLERGAYLLI